MAGKRATSTDKNIGNRVRMRRLELRMSQQTLAKQIGITFQQVQKYENGTNRVAAARLERISEVLDVPIHFFFEAADKSRQPALKRGPAASTRRVADFLATPDGHALLSAFKRIKDLDLRRSVVRALDALPAGKRS
jgi:transcriptional regulator with XRE-family HTH domain